MVRIHRTVEDGGLKVSSAATGLLGASGWETMRALVPGQADPEVLAEMAPRKLRARLPALRTAQTSTAQRRRKA
jgi:transposase